MDSQAPIRSAPRILIVRVGAMGDVLHALPAVAALRQARPECFIGWAVEPRWGALLQSGRAGERGAEMPVVDRIHEVPTREWKQQPFSVRTLRQIGVLRRKLRAERYDLAIDLQGSIRSAFIGRMANAGRFLGPRRPRERQARALYGERIETRAASVIVQACELVGAGIGKRLCPAPVTLPVDPAAELWADDLLLGRIAEDFVLLVPGAGWGAKRWPAEHFRELAERLRGQGVPVLINASADGDPLAAGIAQHASQVVVSTVPQLVALTRRAGLVIGGDTGPVHLAAALGRPTLALFGPTDPERNGPFFPGAEVQILRDPSSRLSHKRLAETEPGLARISVDEVASAASQLLRYSAEVHAHG